MIFHSEFKMIPRRQGESSGGVYVPDVHPEGGTIKLTYPFRLAWLTDTLRKPTTLPTKVGLEYGMESAYDPFGRRISKTIVSDGIGTLCTSPNTCPRTTTYVYDNQNIILEYDTNSEVQTRYTHGPNIDEPLAIEIKGTTTFTPYYYHADGLGSIIALTDTQGNIIQKYEYDSFGNQTITVNGNIAQPYTYTAREYDSETTIYFYRARYYDPKAGRFVSKDPISFAGGDVNLYAYVKNNSIRFKDSRGLLGLETVFKFALKQIAKGVFKKITADPLEEGGKYEEKWLRENQLRIYEMCIKKCEDEKDPCNPGAEYLNCIESCWIYYK